MVEVRSEACPLWPNWHSVANEYCNVDSINDGVIVVTDCVRSGGSYKVSSQLAAEIASFENFEHDGQAAKVVSSLIEQRMLGVAIPSVSPQVVSDVTGVPNLPVDVRANRLLNFFANHTQAIGNSVRLVMNESANAQAYAWSESSSWIELRFLCDYLENQELVTRSQGLGQMNVVVTVKGYKYLAQDATAQKPSQAFVAMWLDDCMDDAYELGIRVGLLESGYNPLRIDKTPSLDKIDDAIIREIRRSRLLVADMTHGGTGVRGSVYYEAGFAHGLGLPVVYTCRSDQITLLHFDTRQYYHIAWSEPAELAAQLTDRVVALVGQGPLDRRQ